MAKSKVVIGFPPDVQKETQGLCVRDINKKLNGSVTVEPIMLTDPKAIVVKLNGAEKARQAIKNALSRHCRHLDVKFAS